MIKNRDFIFTGLQPWDITIGSNAKDIAFEISKNNRVLYVSTPLDKVSYYKNSNKPEDIYRKKVIDHKAPLLRQISNNLWVVNLPFSIWPINRLPDGKIFDWANKINNRHIYTFLNTILNKLNFKNYILFIDNDMYRSFYAKDFLKPILSIYYRRDNMVSTFWQNHAHRIEPLICKKNDIVLTNSEELAENVRSYNNNTYNVGQGVDLTNYNTNIKYDIPQDIKLIPHPIIGYTGMIISSRLDIDLIYYLASSTTYSYVFVGPIEDDIFINHPIRSLKNIHFLGSKDMSLIPNYISAFDICINPQKINLTTIGNYPRKVDEYLALGKPVVATKTNTMKIFEEHVWICQDSTYFLQAIENIIAGKEKSTPADKIQFAHTHSWENNIDNIYEHIANHLQKK